MGEERLQQAREAVKRRRVDLGGQPERQFQPPPGPSPGIARHIALTGKPAKDPSDPDPDTDDEPEEETEAKTLDPRSPNIERSFEINTRSLSRAPEDVPR